jgi:hypothetical protein
MTYDDRRKRGQHSGALFTARWGLKNTFNGGIGKARRVLVGSLYARTEGEVLSQHNQGSGAADNILRFCVNNCLYVDSAFRNE